MSFDSSIGKCLSDYRQPQLPSRRRFMRHVLSGASVATGFNVAGCDAIYQWQNEGKRRGDFLIHDSTNWETLPSSFDTDRTTPREKLYVCNHLPFPDRNLLKQRSKWQLEVQGSGKPTTLTLDDLMSLGSESISMVLQCAGNGRSFFEHEPDGPNWGIGAVGCVEWTGVPMKSVVKALGGLDQRARYATATGGEPINPLLDELLSMRVERSIPLAKALDDCLLAWDLNGAPITLRHGGPLRLVVPGYFGINQIKYLRKLAFTDVQSDSDVMQKQYRIRPKGVEPAPDQPTTWAMSAKSWIWPMGSKRLPGSSLLHGVAFGGLDPIEKVELTWNEGQSWHPVDFTDESMGKYTWRLFDYQLDLAPGKYQVASRATDSAGNVQPEWRTPNAGGYANASWRDHAVYIEIV